MIDSTSFRNPNINGSLGTSIPIIDHSQMETESGGVGMYPSRECGCGYVSIPYGDL